MKQLKSWKTDLSFVSRIQRVKAENKLQIVNAILDSVKIVEYVQ